jgi:UDP-N-acetylmuramate dehydrogenase
MHASQKQNLASITNFINIEENISLADKNWFKTGGIARFFCEPKTPLEFQQALQFANQNQLEIFVLGEGANILISDDGFDGLVIRPKLKNMTIVQRTDSAAQVIAGAGVRFHDLITFCLDNNLTNLEEFSGIPGNVGGCVYINIHYYEFLLDQFLVEAQVIHHKTGVILTVKPEWFNFGYDQSKLLDKEYFLINATFNLKAVSDLEAAYAKGRHKEIIRHRERRYPTQGTCGSFFRNFFPEEVANTDKKLIYVAYYLDKVGVKGELSVGGAAVSHQHANMLVNKGTATSTDLINLAVQMQNLVSKNFGIKPQAECQLVGFKNNPLA